MLSFKEYLHEAFKSTLQYHDTLNKKLWKSDQPVDDLKSYLLKHAYEFSKYSGLKKESIKDIVMTGGNANYNYTKLSDIDVHLMCDISGLNQDTLYDKKVKWTADHPELKFLGYPVEYYIQENSEHFPKGQGVYSLLEDKWLIVPKHLAAKQVLLDPKTVVKIEHLMYQMKELIKSDKKEEIAKFKNMLWKMRTEGLEKAGEFSDGNCIYKDLRNRGLVDKLNKRLESL